MNTQDVGAMFAVASQRLPTLVADMTLAVWQLADAMGRAAVTMDQFGHVYRRKRIPSRRDRVRRLLGFEDDASAPAWVRRQHEIQIAQFGSGNGRVR